MTAAIRSIDSVRRAVSSRSHGHLRSWKPQCGLTGRIAREVGYRGYNGVSLPGIATDTTNMFTIALPLG